MITHEEAKNSLYFMDITADMVVFNENQKVVGDYISQQEKKDELSLLKSRIINEYQRYLVCLHTHDYKLKEVVKNEIFKLLDEKGKLEKELGEMK